MGLVRAGLARHAVALGLLMTLMTFTPAATAAASTSAGPDWAALGATVRMPEGATDWATFSASERQAALSWVEEQFEFAASGGTLRVRTISANPVGALSITPLVTGGYNCGFNHSDFTYGTWTWARASTSTSQGVWEIDTGFNGILDKFFRNNSLLETFHNQAQNLNYSYIYESTTQNFKWWFESATYFVQSYHTAQTSPGVYVVGPNAYCSMSFSP